MKTLKIGIAGAGTIGDAHAGAISRLEDQTLVAAADPQDSARARLAELYSIPKTFSSWEDMVADDSLDVIYVCTPNDLHMPVAVAALDAGKHVVCEKPLARNLQEGRAMIDAAERSGRKLFVALNHRFWPPNQKVKHMLEEGALGRPFLAVSTFIGNEFERMDDPASWKGTKERSGGGVLIDNGTHMLDLLRWWLGDAIAVTARCGRLGISATNKEEDTAAVAIEFESGALAELSLTFAARFSAWPPAYGGAAIRTEIFGLEGSVKVGNDGPPVQFITAGHGFEQLTEPDFPADPKRSLHAHFAACIREEAVPLVTARDGLAALEIVEAGYLSARLGQRVTLESSRAAL